MNYDGYNQCLDTHVKDLLALIITTKYGTHRLLFDSASAAPNSSGTTNCLVPGSSRPTSRVSHVLPDATQLPEFRRTHHGNRRQKLHR